MRILVVEDNPELGPSIQESLSGFAVDLNESGTEGLKALRDRHYDLAIVDIGLPDISGVEVCREMRAADVKTPVLILTPYDELAHKLEAFAVGADDYLTKPFEEAELLARVRALLRRPADALVPEVIDVGDLIIDTSAHTVTREGIDITLRRKEFQLLEYLARNKGRVITRRMILETIWSDESEPRSNTVSVHIKFLRDKIDKPFAVKLLKTLPGIGYKLDT